MVLKESLECAMFIKRVYKQEVMVLKESLECAMFLKSFYHYKQEVTLLNKRQKLSLSRSHKESFSNMAAPLDLTRKCEMCDFIHLKRVQFCIKPAGSLFHESLFKFIHLHAIHHTDHLWLTLRTG